MKAIKILITDFIDEHQPGFVKCKFYDALGKQHIVLEKIPVVTDKYLDINSAYPQDGVIACEVIEEGESLNGQKIFKINTANPWGVETIDGFTEFAVFEEQIIELQS